MPQNNYAAQYLSYVVALAKFEQKETSLDETLLKNQE